MVSKLVVGIIVAIVVVGGGVAAYVLVRPSEAPEKYDLSYDYQVGEYYVYETTATTTSTQDDMETETPSSSTYSMQVTTVEDDEITIKQTGTELIAEENVDVTLLVTMSNKGEMISWEIENVVPPEYWDDAVAYENQSMIFWELLGYELPEEAIPIGHEWRSSIEYEIPWGPEGIPLPITGEMSAHFVGEESITVEAGTFDCWRIEHSTSISGEMTVNNHTVMMDMIFEETNWFDNQNCAQVKSTMSYTMDMEYDGYTMGSVYEGVTELVEYGTT